MKTLKAYKFLSTKYALEALKYRKLKVATLDSLNDSHEMQAVNLKEKRFRKDFKSKLKELAEIRGFISFSQIWNNPIMWAHYADNQKGMCICFEIPEKQIFEMLYVKKRINRHEIHGEINQPNATTNSTKKIFAKSKHWQYEKELRQWYDLEETQYDKNKELYFVPFGKNLKPVEVFIGPNCNLTDEQLKEMNNHSTEVTITKTRAAFKNFSIVKDKRGLRVT